MTSDETIHARVLGANLRAECTLFSGEGKTSGRGDLELCLERVVYVSKRRKIPVEEIVKLKA